MSDLLQYMNSLTYLSREAFSSIPSDLVPDLQRMLSSNETFRPTASDFTGENTGLSKFLCICNYVFIILNHVYHMEPYSLTLCTWPFSFERCFNASHHVKLQLLGS